LIGRAVTLGGSLEFTIIELTGDRAVAEMQIADGIRNPFGSVHAGALLWFADVTATRLILGPDRPPTLGMQGFPLAITLNANFISNQTSGTLRAVASFVKRGRTVNVVRTFVYGDGDKLIADITTNHVPSR
jgi:1,4-dihydroxy-2-naphthoyl-CoA hydrolase